MALRSYLWPLLARLLMLTLLVTHTAVRANDNPLKFRLYSLNEGLSQGTVTSLIQDHQGFLWLATQDGLNRFDGYQFKIFIHEPNKPQSISSDYITALFETATGDLWVGTSKGLNRFDRQHETFDRYKLGEETRDNVGSQTINGIHPGPDGKLWVSTLGGLFLLDPDSREFQHFLHDPNDPTSIAHNEVFDFLTDSNHQLWIGTTGGLDRLNPDQQSFTHFNNNTSQQHPLSGNNITDLKQDSEGQLWISTYNNGLNRLDPTSGTVTRYQHDQSDPNSLSHNRVRSLMIDQQGSVWVGTQAGLNLFQPDNNHFIRYTNNPSVPSSLSNDHIWAMLEDNHGSLWFATSDGVNQLSKSTRLFGHQYKTAIPGLGISHKRVRSIAKTHDDIVWVGVDNGLNKYDPHTKRYTYYQHDPSDSGSISSGMVMALLVDSEQRLWAGTYDNGLNLLLPTGQFKHFTHDPNNANSLSNNRVYSIKQDRQGFIWIGTVNGLNKFDPQTHTFEHFFHHPDDDNSLSQSGIYTTLHGDSGDVWIATRNGGVTHYNPKNAPNNRFERFVYDPDNPNSLSHDRVFSLYQSAKNQLWLATSDGLNLLDTTTKTFTRYSKKQGLLNNTIYAVTGDNQGYIWVSNNHGLSRFDPNEQQFKNFDALQGLQSNEFNNGAYFKGYDGELFFGGINGFNRFYPQLIKDNPQPPNVVLTEFYLANQPPGLRQHQPKSPLEQVINETTHLTLSYKNPVFSFEFAALHFTHPENNRYAYMLAGFDQQPTQTHAFHRRATYTNLPAGDYTFLVKAANSDGIWQQTDKQIAITITPAPWRTHWAYALYLLIIGSTIAAFAFLHDQKQKAKAQSAAQLQALNDELELRVEQRTEELASTVENLAATIEQLTHAREQLVEAQKMAALGALVTGVAHEINTPIGICITSVSTLEALGQTFFQRQSDNKLTRSAFEQYKHTCNETLQLVMNNLNRTAKLVQTFKTVSVQQSTDARAKCHLQQLFQSVVSCFAPQLAAKNVVVCITDDANLSVLSYPGSLELIISQLINNSLIHGFSQQAFAQSSFDQIMLGKINITLTGDQQHVYISYQDNGTGLQQTTKEQVFEPFYTTCRGQGESGLGMHIVFNHVTQRLNGSIEIDDNFATGFAVKITLTR